MSRGPEDLHGGNMGKVTRDGDTVLRPAGAWTPAVHRLLAHLIAAGVPGVPRPVEVTTDSRERVGFLEGTVPSHPMPSWVWGEVALVSAARLLRSVHDATVGVDLPGPWRSPTHEPVEVVCHNDFATYNLVFTDGEVVGAIDWDFASPGPRTWDLAHLAYRIVPLSQGDRRDGFTDEERRSRLSLLIQAYDVPVTPSAVLDVLVDRLHELAEHSDRAARDLGNLELSEHAELYRDDAAHLATMSSRVS